MESIRDVHSKFASWEVCSASSVVSELESITLEAGGDAVFQEGKSQPQTRAAQAWVQGHSEQSEEPGMGTSFHAYMVRLIRVGVQEKEVMRTQNSFLVW